MQGWAITEIWIYKKKKKKKMKGMQGTCVERNFRKGYQLKHFIGREFQSLAVWWKKLSNIKESL